MKYEPETIDRIEECLRNRSGRVIAARTAGISYETFSQWYKNKPEFAELVKRAEAESSEESKEIAVMAIFEAIQKGTWQAAAWWLERRFADEFSQKVRQDVNIDSNKEQAKAVQALANELINRTKPVIEKRSS